MDVSRHSWSDGVTVPFAIFAAFGGAAAAYTAAGTMRWSLGLFAPFFIGGVVTIGIFWLLVRTSPSESEHPVGRVRDRGSSARDTRRAARPRAKSRTDKRVEWTTVFLSVATLFTIGGAFAVGAGDGGLPTTRRQAVELWLSGGLESAFAGFMLSLPVAGSAGALMWIMRRGR
jgi:hypothetical protein